MDRQMKKQSQAILQPYVLAHLAEEMRDFTDIQDDILVTKKYPSLSSINTSAEHKIYLEKLTAEKLTYIERIIRDLRATGYK